MFLNVCRSGVQESTPAGVSVFQQDSEQEWIFLIRTGARAGSGVIFSRVFFRFRCIFAVYINCYTGVKQEQESINFVLLGVTPEAGVDF